MNIQNNSMAKNKMFGKRPALRYGTLALAVLMAAIMILQIAPGGSEDTEAAVTIDYPIDLDSPVSTTGVTWDGVDLLTFDSLADNFTYEIAQTNSAKLPRNIKIEGVTTITVVIKNININGSIVLASTGSLNLLLSGSNNISGNILMQTTYATITIDSADSTGSNNGSLRVDASTNAAIGSLGSSGTIIIKGGTVTANGGTNGAGIGGGYNGSGGAITISGGKVTANGSATGAGIGGGGYGSGGAITISGGTVEAHGSNGAGIGGGNSGNGGTVTITGGKVVATSSNGAGIGGGKDGSGAVLTLGDNVEALASSGGTMSAIQISNMGSANTGYFVNALVGTDLPSNILSVYAAGNTATELAELTLPVDYKGFAIVLPGTASKNYNIYTKEAGVLVPLLRDADDSNVISSINNRNGYNAYNGNANDAVLPVKLPTFIAVTGITLASSTTTVGTPLTLTGTVAPSDASHKTIVWTVKSAGTTGAAIDGSGVLTATDSGKVTVTATITNGTAMGTAYTKDFEITVKGEGTSIWLWVGIVIAIIAIAVIALFILNRMGKVNIKLKP